MTAIARLYRTTAFKLLVANLVVFTVFAAVLVGYFAHNTGALLARQHADSTRAEMRAVQQVFRRGGIRRVVDVIDWRSRRPGAGLYLVTAPDGRVLAGNIAGLPIDIFDRPGMNPIRYERVDRDGEIEMRPALVRSSELPGGFRVLIGRDMAEAHAFQDLVRRAFVWSVLAMTGLAVVGGFLVSRRVLKRMESVSEASQTIMDGDLSRRIPVTGTGDEFDRLAESLNRMLERIEQLLTGLKEVSDNVAHDLKTPLTRARNRVEAALRDGSADEPAYRAVLEETLVDCDTLISTFDALLAIARAEAGEGSAMESLDVAMLVRDIGELYEPAAEEAGIALTTDVPATLRIEANRHLLSQAIANLVDNALKHGREAENPQVDLSVTDTGDSVDITVTDNGPGIPDTEAAKVTERFVRLEKSRTTPGSGLGLALVKAAAQRHQGSLRLVNARPGLTAIIRLPKRQSGEGDA